MGTLSVRENLHFSAALRLPSSMNHKQRKERVEKIINELGLTKCADTKVQYCEVGLYVIITVCTMYIHVHIHYRAGKE